jgi:hypothetical protein
MGAVRGSGQGVVEGAEMEEGVEIAGGTGGAVAVGRVEVRAAERGEVRLAGEGDVEMAKGRGVGWRWRVVNQRW